MAYRISLDAFEGPLDLLLFFIRRDELDVHDIPVARITDEFLEYVRLIERLDLDGAADFIYMAALLVQIKARMLLPRPELDEAGEPIDPRQELVERLLDYMRYKEAATHLDRLSAARDLRFTRGLAADRGPMQESGPPMYRVSLLDLVTALRRVYAEAEDDPTHAVARVAYTVEQQIGFVLGRLAEGAVPFTRLVSPRGDGPQTKPFVIATFLAILDLANRQQIRVRRTGQDFLVERAPTPAAHAA